MVKNQGEISVMFLNEKCGICREKIPDEENFYKLIFSEFCSEDVYDERAVFYICYGCFTSMFLGAHGQRKGVAPWRVGDEKPT